MKALKKLEITATAVLDEGAATGHDLKIGQGAEHIFRRIIRQRDVEVLGSLKAKIRATGLVSVRAGALLQGEVHGSHLCVDEGGGLKAKVFIEESEEIAEEPNKRPLKKTA